MMCFYSLLLRYFFWEVSKFKIRSISKHVRTYRYEVNMGKLHFAQPNYEMEKSIKNSKGKFELKSWYKNMGNYQLLSMDSVKWVLRKQQKRNTEKPCLKSYGKNSSTAGCVRMASSEKVFKYHKKTHSKAFLRSFHVCFSISAQKNNDERALWIN